jgi:hypothetical protein
MNEQNAPSNYYPDDATAAAERRALQESIDKGISKLRNQKWNANLPFRVRLCLKSENLPCTPTSFVKTNLFELMSAIHGLGQGTIARFDPSAYPVRSPNMSDNIETSNDKASSLQT